MEWFDGGWGLSLTVFLPLVGAVIMMVIPRTSEAALKWVAMITSLATLALAGILVSRFDLDAAGEFQLGTNLDWIPAINANYHIGVDGISLPLVVLSAFITVLVVIYSWNHWPEPHNPKALLILIMVLAVGMTGTFVALDLVLFFVFFEIVLLPMYFMIGIWGDRTMRRVPVVNWDIELRLYASLKFFLFTLFGSAFMLLGFLALYFQSGTVGERTFDILELSEL